MSSRMIKTVTLGVVFCLALFLLAPRSIPGKLIKLVTSYGTMIDNLVL